MAKINFDEAAHEYKVANKLYTSTTQLMKKYGLTADYGGIPAAILAKAAKKGTAVHKALEAHILGNKSVASLFREVELFENHCVMRGLDATKMTPEAIVFDTNYEIAGTLDIQYIDGNEDIIADFKTTSSLHMDAVAWQLSIYNYLVCAGDMIQYYFKQLKVIHFTQGRMYVKNVPTIDYDAIVALLEAHKRRDPVFTYVRPNKIILPTEETYLLQILNEEAIHKDALDVLDAEKKIILDKLKEKFITNKEYSYRNKTLSVTYADAITKNGFSTKLAKVFIKKHGGDLDDFVTTTITKAKVGARLVMDKTTVHPSDSSDQIPF